MSDLKEKAVEALVEANMKDGDDHNGAPQHSMIRVPNGERQRCSYCKLTGQHSRTRYMCDGCGVPYCSMGSGKTGKDCFSLAHHDEEIRKICIANFERQQKHTRKQVLKKR
jgi:hypothetical protein